MLAVKISGEVSIEGEPSQFFDEILTAKELKMARDRVARLVGSGDSRIAVGMELKDKDMGSGYGAFVTVSLACDASEDAVEEAADLATRLAKSYVDDAFETARELYKEIHRR